MRRKSSTKKSSSAAASKTGKARPAARGAKQNSRPAPAACYVSVAPAKLSIARARPITGDAAACTTFQQARDAAVESLVAAIEQAERQLTECKRASSIEQLQAL
jgi:hypothetical protein